MRRGLRDSDPVALVEAAAAVTALFRGEAGQDAEVGAVLVAEWLARAAGAIGSR